MTVVTVTSQYGAGARDVGRRIASRMDLYYVDQAVLVNAARQLGVTLNRVTERDERTDSFRDRLGHFLQRALERSAAGGNVDPLLGAGNLELMLAQSYQDVMEGPPPGLVDDRAYVDTIAGLMRDLAERGNVVLIGRGSQMILRDWVGAVHVHIVADDSTRIERIMAWESIDADQARHRMRAADRSREAFHKKFFKVDVWDPHLYDVVINTTTLSFDTSAEIGLLVAQAKAAARASA